MPKKFIAIIIGLVVIIGGGIGAYFYFTNTPKNKYLLSEKKSYEAMNEYVGQRFESELAMQKDMTDDSYKMGASLYANVPDELIESMGIPASMVNSSKIEMSAAHDPNNKTSRISINPTVADSEIGNIVWSADKSYQYIEAPVLKTPLKFKNAEIIKSIEKLTGEKLSDTQGITNETLNLNTLMSSTVTQDDIDEITSRYLRFILEEIDGDKFTKGEDKVTVLGKEKTLDSVTLNLKPEDVKKLILSTLKEMKTDKDIQKIVKDTDVSIEYKKEIDDIIKEVEKAEKKEFPTIKSVIYVEGKDVQKRLMTVDFDGDALNVEMDTNIAKDIDMKLVVGSNEQPEFIQLEGSSKGKDDVKDHYTLTVGDEISADITNKETLKDKTRQDAVVFNINADTENYVVKYDQKLMTDAKNNKQTSKGVISFDMGGEPIQIHVDTDTVLKEKLDVKLADAQDMNDFTEEEMNQLKQDASSKMLGLYFTLMGAAQ
ncbi:MAG: hypothetical protein KBT36_10360 [Kurthia sp.]|nr:hypothetical protein [Candidatus Kurthia equi]